MSSQEIKRCQLLLGGKEDKSTRRIGQKMNTGKPLEAAIILQQQDQSDTPIDLKTKQGWQRKYNEPTGYWIGGSISTKVASMISTARGEDRNCALDGKSTDTLGSVQHVAQEMTPCPKLDAPHTEGWARLGSDVLKQSPPYPTQSPQKSDKQKQYIPDKKVILQKKARTSISTEFFPNANTQSITETLGNPLKGGWSRLGSDVVKQSFQSLQQGNEQEQKQGRCSCCTEIKIPPNDKARGNCNQYPTALPGSDNINLLTTNRRLGVLATQRAARQKHLGNIEVNFLDEVHEPLGPPCGTECPKVDDKIQFPNL